MTPLLGLIVSVLSTERTGRSSFSSTSAKTAALLTINLSVDGPACPCGLSTGSYVSKEQTSWAPAKPCIGKLCLEQVAASRIIDDLFSIVLKMVSDSSSSKIAPRTFVSLTCEMKKSLTNCIVHPLISILLPLWTLPSNSLIIKRNKNVAQYLVLRLRNGS